MKRIIILFALSILAQVGFSQELCPDAQIVKEKFPELYEGIYDRAFTEWGTDATMVLWEINNQSEAFEALIRNPDLISSVFENAYEEWCDPSYPGVLRYDLGRADWVMIRWEYDRQIEAMAVLLGIN